MSREVGREHVAQRVQPGELSEPRPSDVPPGRRVPWRVLLAGAALSGLFLAGYLPRQRQHQVLRAQASEATREQLRPALVHPKPSPSEERVELPVTLRGEQETEVYARASGFVRRWLVDMGEPVKAGALLAELDTPELDRDLERARARRVQALAAVTKARASRTFAESSFARLGPLSGRGLVSKQELAQSEAQLGVESAQVEVAEAERLGAEAELGRLEQLKSFARIVAPFAGIVTARKVERGGLVVAGGASPLFHVAAVDRVHAHASLPQALALALGPAAEATLVVSELGRRFPARLGHRAGSFDATTRTMDVELVIDNPEHVLVPGMYARLELQLPHTRPSLRIPASALITDAEGTQVARVAADRRVELAHVRVARDLGGELEIEEGLSPADQVLVNPPPGLSAGEPLELP